MEGGDEGQNMGLQQTMVKPVDAVVVVVGGRKGTMQTQTSWNYRVDEGIQVQVQHRGRYLGSGSEVVSLGWDWDSGV